MNVVSDEGSDVRNERFTETRDLRFVVQSSRSVSDPDNLDPTSC